MRLLFGRLVLMTGRQLRHLIGAAIHPSTRSPENVDGQDGRSHAALLAVSTSRSSHDRVSPSKNISFIGEFGGLSHAPFEKAAAVAPVVDGPDTFTASKLHVNGYHYNANLMVAPANWYRVTPYLTGGFGAFTGSTVARYNVGPTWQRRYDSATNFATNVGGGLTYRVNRWLGANADYRHFIVNADAIEHVNRFTTGISLFVR